MKDDNYPVKNQDDELDEISKSAVKREMQRLQDIGKRLTEMNPGQWEKLTLSDTLIVALEESKRLKQNEAKRRHMQYIGKVMRNEDIDAIQNELDLLDPSSEAYGRLTGQLEKWRDRLVKDAKAMNQFIDEYPNVDRQQLRNLVRNAAKEVSSEPPKPGTAFKKLYKMIKEHVTAG